MKHIHLKKPKTGKTGCICKTPINGLLKSLMAHKKISLPDRGKDKDKLFI